MKRGRKSTQERGLILSEREKQVLDNLGTGLQYLQVGIQLGISKETVRRHAANIYMRLNVRNKKQAIEKFYCAEERLVIAA